MGVRLAAKDDGLRLSASAAAQLGRPASSDPRPTIEWLMQRIDQLESIAEIFPGGLAVFDARLNMVVCNSHLRTMLEYPEALFANGYPHIEELFRFNAERGEYGPGDVDEHIRNRVDLVRRRVPHVYERTRPNGTVVEVRGVPINGGGFLTTYFDVTEQRRRANEFAVLIDNYPGGIALFDQNLNMVVCNSRLKTMLEYPDSLFAGSNPNIVELFRFNAERGEYGPGDVEQVVADRVALVEQRTPHEYERMRPDGTVLQVRGIPVPGGGFVTTYADVTEKRQAQERIAHLAHHDELTGLPNRLLLQDRLKQALASVRRGDGGLALHYLDLDNFKPVNDAYGHGVGDGLLKAVADRLREQIRDSDTAARIGGDEFVVMQTRLQDRGDAMALARRLVRALEQPFKVGGHEIRIGVSIGIAVAPAHGNESDQLFRQADRALYNAKSAGRGRFTIAS